MPPLLQISLVSQEPVLFARSITDNISYGLPAVPFEMVVEAAQKANAHSFIMELQDGYNTGAGQGTPIAPPPQAHPPAPRPRHAPCPASRLRPLPRLPSPHPTPTSGMLPSLAPAALRQLPFSMAGEIHVT